MKNAVVILKSDGNVLLSHSIEGGIGAPSNDPGELENLLSQGYLLKRVTVIGEGQTLLVLEKAD